MSEQIEGRNAVLEAFRSGRCVDKLFILDGCQDGPVRTIAREARKKDTIINYVSKERLDQLSETRAHQGVIAQVAAYEYSTVEEILEKGVHYVEVALNEVPLFIRSGKCIPVAEAAECVKDIDTSKLTMLGYEGSSYTLYEDDGVHKEYDKAENYRKLEK